MYSKCMGRIQAEIRQARPFSRPEHELAVTLMRTGDVLHHSIDRALDPMGLSNEQYNVLRILRGAGEAGHPTLEISRRLISRAPNITRLLDKVIAKGLVRRDRGTEDRRQAFVRITPKGLGLLARCDKVVDAALDKLRCLSRADLKRAVDLLDRVREAVAIATVWEGILADKTDSSDSPTHERRR